MIAFTASDGHTIFINCGNCLLRRTTFSQGSEIVWVYALAFAPDGRTLASGSNDRTIILWDVAAGRPLGPPLSGHRNWVTSVAFSPDGKILASGSADRTLLLWDVATHHALSSRLIGGHRRGVTSVVWSPDGETVASGGDDKRIIIWDLGREASRR